MLDNSGTFCVSFWILNSSVNFYIDINSWSIYHHQNESSQDYTYKYNYMSSNSKSKVFKWLIQEFINIYSAFERDAKSIPRI
jgi:hypothetical protein